MKAAYLIAIMIIIAASVDIIEDKIADNEFRAKAKTFINKGGRNTSTQGKQLCERINALESLHNAPQTDCDKLYD